MLLTLRILSYRNQPVPGGGAGQFAAGGGTLGRGADNDLVLDDPGKYISRVHARVSLRDGAFYIEDLGSNASVINDRPLGKGRETALGHGDRLVIGDYQLQAVLEEDAVAPVPPAPPNNPELPLFVPPPVAAPAPLPPFEPLAAAPPAPPAARFPDALAGASILDVGTPVQSGHAPLGLNQFAATPAKPARAADSDHVSPELAAFSMPKPAAFAIPQDYNPLADLFPPAAAPAPPQQKATPAAPVKQTSQAPASDDGEVLAALLRGLGLPGLQLNRAGAEVAETVGAMLREATAGTIDVLMARALTKKESRIEMTMLAVRANNPLKFFPNADGALTQMLTNSMAGYLPPVQAMASAFDDLRAHELAVIAGMRAALAAVLHRFDPQQIERRLAVPTVMDKLMSANRKAKLWDGLVAVYGEIAREADDDLQRLYGEKFSEAYEEQVARLRQAH
ncbi:MAG: type VI secretion system-associated FHA domain protein TagH [Telluria sp.]